MPVRILKISIIICWLILLGLLIQRDFFISRLDNAEQMALSRAQHEQYYGVFLNNERIGFIMEDFRPAGDNGFKVRQQANLRLKVLNTTQPVTMQLTANLDDSLRLQTFTFTFSSPFYTMDAEGRTEGNNVHFSLNTGQDVIKDTLTLQAPPLLPVNQRGYLIDLLTTPGDKLKVPIFDPLSLSDRESVILYRGKEKIVLNGLVHNLHHFTESYSGMQVNFWLNDQGKIIREKSAAGFVFEAEPKFKAMDIEGDEVDQLASTAVHYTGNLPPADSETAVYQLKLPNHTKVELIGGRQRLVDGNLVLTMEMFPPSGRGGQQDCADQRYLLPSRYILSEQPDIILQAEKIVGTETDPAEQVRLLTNWLFNHLEKRPVIGLPDAATTLKNGRGDCNEHAVLFAALARSLKIPTVIATGVSLQNNRFYYHAWNEVCLAGQWISLDATTNQLPADLYHIRLSRGNMDEQLESVTLLDKLEINVVKQEP